jgi:hypothetical protein
MFSHIKELFTRPSGYTIAKSVRLRSSASAYLNRTPATASNRKTWTWSGWVKRGALGARQTMFAASLDGNNENWITFQTTDTLIFYNFESSSQYSFETTQVFRDPSAWYHIVVALDTTQATSTNRAKIYINGLQVTSFITSTYPSQNFDGRINNNVNHAVGRSSSAFPNYFDGYLAEVNFIDGQALTPSSFGSTNALTGVWQPARYTGTYGTNGFYLNFSDNSNNTATTIGKDYSGNGNNWTPNNISVTAGSTYDSMTDVPTLTSATAANYCVLNPINATSASGTSLSNGNLQINGIGSGNVNEWLGTMGVSSGKWYYEVVMGENNGVVGISQTGNPNTYPGGDATSYGYSTATKYNNGSSSSYGASLTAGDIVGIAYDLDAGTITFYKNGTSQGQAFSGLSGIYFPAVRAGSTGAAVSVNFGQRPFSYTPPTGFVALNTYNLPDSTIKNGANYMAATTYAGNGANGRSVTNGFRPDFIWVKNRSSAQDNILGNSLILTSGEPTLLSSNSTSAEFANGYIGNTSQWTSTSFTVNGDSRTNASGSNYVAWTWLGGNTNGSGSSNTSGSITSTVSAGATQGFSVVTYTGNGSAGATFGHGLGVAPSFVIVKERSNANGWLCYHISTGNTGYLELDATLAFQTLSTVWNNTTPSSSVVTLGTVSNVNRNGGTFVAYCFAAVKGFSAFGSYTGNGSTDGPFVYTGFRPRFVLWKITNTTSSWVINDSARNTYNVEDAYLIPNNTNAEGTLATVDFLSNGFKLRTTDQSWNQSGSTYIYAAFAENPFKNSLAR